MDVLIGILIAVASGILSVWLYSRFSSEAYWRAYDAAQLKDLEYARQHPGCSYEEAHRHRDAVMKKFHRY